MRLEKRCRFSAINSLVVCLEGSMTCFWKSVAAFFDMFAVSVVGLTWTAAVPINRQRSVEFAVIENCNKICF